MKKNLYLFLLIISLLFSGCASVRNLADYDEDTFEKKEIGDRQILGTISVSSLGLTWQSLSPGDRKTIQLMNKLEDKAIKKYGPNIDLVDVDIGGMHRLSTMLMWGTSSAAFFGGMICSQGIFSTTVENKNSSSSYSSSSSKSSSDTTKVITNQTGYNISMGVSFSLLPLFFFKGIEAKALVVSSDTPYKKGRYRLIDEEEISKKQNLYYANKEKIEKRQTEKKNQELLNNLKNQLINRGKEISSPIVLLDYGILSINSADGVSCYVEFINTSGKLAKYVNIELVPYNRVFDKAYSHIGGESEKFVNVTNFIGPNENYTGMWENVWYNSTISSMKISKIEVIFADNTKSVISNAEDIDKIQFAQDELSLYRKLK